MSSIFVFRIVAGSKTWMEFRSLAWHSIMILTVGHTLDTLSSVVRLRLETGQACKSTRGDPDVSSL